MSNGNAGEQTLKIMLKAAWFIILLIPGFVKMIYKAIVWIINEFKSHKNESVEADLTGTQEQG